MYLYILIFIASCFGLYISGKWLIESLARIARILKWKEFVVAFFIMAFAGSIPNLFLGIFSALNKIPELSFGDIVGGNLIDLTIVIALAVLVSKGGLPANSRAIQATSLFTMVIAVLPAFLIFDGYLSRTDGMILIAAFFVYVIWLFSKKERFSKIYEEEKEEPIIKEVKHLIFDFGKTILGLVILFAASLGIVESAKFFAIGLNMNLALVGILIVAFGNTIPEAYFAIVSARKGQTWMILGNLMGAIIVPASLVLGIVAIICPIRIDDSSPFIIARIFLIISALFFFFFVKTDKKITKKEAIFLFGIYTLFVIIQLLMK